jgi:hypothetical protein
MSEKPVFHPAKVKKIIQSDREIGKLVKQVSHLSSKLVETFVKKLTREACAVAEGHEQTTLNLQHFVEVIEGRTEYAKLAEKMP